MLIQAWGQVTLNGRFTVDRTGSIYIPQVGTMHVAGLNFAQMQDYLKAQMGRVFRNFDLNVNMGQLRSIQVFVVGQARRPGSYTISSLSTLTNALFATGGPTPQGSMRHIQLKRSGNGCRRFRFVRSAAAWRQVEGRSIIAWGRDLHSAGRTAGRRGWQRQCTCDLRVEVGGVARLSVRCWNWRPG